MHHPTPVQRLFGLLKLDRSDLAMVILYTMMAGLLSLAVPLAAQALVNFIAAGIVIQPVIVLTLIVFIGLGFAGLMRLLQFHLVEVMQQRIFTRVALQLATQIPNIQHQAIGNHYLPELVNRFFDVVKLQKAVSKLLMDGPAAVLQIAVGLILMGIYSPYLLGFDLFIIAALAFIAFGLGMGGLKSSIAESVQKYRVAGWLEELARCQVSFKVDGVPAALLQKADDIVVKYLQARRSHFSVLFRQAGASFLLQAIVSAGILAIGGWLVINRQLTLGQLVASELVVLIVLAAMEKLVFMFQDFYDLLTALDKIGHITDLPLERPQGMLLPSQANGAKVDCRNVYFSYGETQPVLSDLNLALPPGQVACLVGPSGAGKSTLAMVLCGLMEPKMGVVEVNQVDVRTVNLESLRQQVALVTDMNEVFDGSVEDNIRVGRENITQEDIRWALEMTHLTQELGRLPQGLKTPLVSLGRNLSRGQVQRLMIARAIADRPKLLILDEAFSGLDEITKILILQNLSRAENGWTLLSLSHDSQVVARSQKIYVMLSGNIVEQGTPEEFLSRPDSVFRQLFPEFAGIR
jgi:ABC-type bacteriocin/lantibiotic exporter with double-glycine peptidase domain